MIPWFLTDQWSGSIFQSRKWLDKKNYRWTHGISGSLFSCSISHTEKEAVKKSPNLSSKTNFDKRKIAMNYGSIKDIFVNLFAFFYQSTLSLQLIITGMQNCGMKKSGWS